MIDVKEKDIKIYTKSIDMFHYADLRNEVKDELATLLLDYGQKFDETEVRYLVNRITDLLSKKYRSWIFNDFHVACEMGKLGSFQGATGMKVTVRLVEQWLYRYNDIRMKRAADEQIRSNIARKSQKTEIIPGGSLYAAALKWKLQNSEAFKIHKNWEKCSLQMVVDAFKDQSIHDLKRKLFNE